MKISLNWLKKFVTIPESVSNEELVRLIGARLVEVEAVVDEGEKYNNIYVVEVKKAEKIPDTHLTLCQIDAGETELIQVVCGAPNVREGMLAAWIKPGAIVPASVHEDAPFKIGKRKMLGKYDSNGMLAGADELDFGDDHSGIVEIEPGTAKPGDLLKDVFELDDLVLEIENKSLTHRPDCFGMIGFAREVAGILGQKFDHAGENVAKNDEGSFESVAINIASPEICKRYSALVLEKHGEIKKKYLSWVDTILAKSGMKPVSPIVDATNYLMLLTGQPLHAFDYDKFVEVGKTGKPAINVRLAKKAEKLVLLDDKEIELTENDIVICSGETPVALAGAMGGKSTMIDENTKNIIIESATFSLYNLRKTQMAHGIFSEAITRFTKGQPTYQTLDAAMGCADLLSSGFVVVAKGDNIAEPEKDIVVKITTKEINELLGTNYSDALIMKTLENVGFKINASNSELEIDVPKWRTDIVIKEDIVEEIGRLLGYDNILPTLPMHRTAEGNQILDLKHRIRDISVRYGMHEVLTYSFISGRLMEKSGLDSKNSYRIVNSISPELQFVRQSIVPSLLDKTYVNSKIPVDEFAIFEMNKVYRKEWGMDEDNIPVEGDRFGMVVYERKGRGTAFYKAKKYVDKILREFGIQAEYLPLKKKDAETKPFEPKRAAEIVVDGEYIGVVGEFRNVVKREFKLDDYLAGAEIDLGKILALENDKKEVKSFVLKKKEDLTVTTTKNYAEVLKEVKNSNPKAKITPVGIYQSKGSEEKNITFHLETY